MATILSRTEGAWRSMRPLQLRLHHHSSFQLAPGGSYVSLGSCRGLVRPALLPVDTQLSTTSSGTRRASTVSGLPKHPASLDNPGPGTVGATAGSSNSPSEAAGDRKDKLFASLGLVQDIFRQGNEPPEWDFLWSPQAASAETESLGSHPLNQLPRNIQTFIQKLRLRDVRTALVEAQKDGTFLDPDPWVSISQPSFSAILRCLDPFKMGPLVDPTHDIHIPPAAMQQFALTDIIEPSGVPRVYAVLFRIVQWLFAIRIATGSLPTRSDWKYLMRLAGTTGDRSVARRVWSASAQVQRGSGVDVRNSDDYTEFIRSRFQTIPLYHQFNIPKSRVSIFDIGFKSNVKMPSARRRVLYAIRLRKARRSRRYNPSMSIEDVLGSGDIAYGSEWFHDLFGSISARGIVASEDLICTAIAAFARMGSLRTVRKLLDVVWQVKIHIDKEVGNVTVQGGRSLPSTHPLFPTKRLLDTVILAFGSNAEIQTSIKLADFLSNRYSIPLSSDVWTAMLTWTYIAASKQVSWEWKQAGFPDKLVDPEAIQMVWDTMTSNPYNVEPCFSDYDIFIKFLLSKGRVKEATKHIYDARDMHWMKQEKEFRSAEEAYVIALQMGNCTDRQALRYERALVLRAVMHWRISSWMSRLSTYVRPKDDCDGFVVCHIPKMLHDFKEFVHSPFIYNTYNGTVSLREKVRNRHSEIVRRDNPEDLALTEALRWQPPSNFASKRWFRHLLEYRARYLGLAYPGAAYGPKRLGLGRPLIRRPRFRGRMVTLRQGVGPSKLRVVQKKISNSWHTVDLHFSTPQSPKDITPYARRVPLCHLRTPPRHIRGLYRQFNNDTLVPPPGPAQALQDGPRLATLATVFSGLMRRGRKRVSQENLTKWKDLRFTFIHGLHPGIGEQWPWEYSLKEWPNVAGDRMQRLAQARRTRIFLDGKRVTRKDLKDFPVVERARMRATGRRVLVRKHRVGGTLPQKRGKKESDFFHALWMVQAARENRD